MPAQTGLPPKQPEMKGRSVHQVPTKTDGETFSSLATNDKAEAEALKTVVTQISSNIPRTHKKIVTFTYVL